MPMNRDFYVERADEARRDAEAASLDNVRDRHLRAAAAWDVMAARAGRTVRRRAEIDARKAAAEATAAADLQAPAAGD